MSFSSEIYFHNYSGILKLYIYLKANFQNFYFQIDNRTLKKLYLLEIDLYLFFAISLIVALL